MPIWILKKCLPIFLRTTKAAAKKLRKEIYDRIRDELVKRAKKDYCADC